MTKNPKEGTISTSLPRLSVQPLVAAVAANGGSAAVMSKGVSSPSKSKIPRVQSENSLFSMFEKDENNQRVQEGTSSVAEEDKKVLIIYACGFFGADYDKSGSRLQVKPRALEEKMRGIEYFCDINFTYQHATEGFLVTPLTEYKKRIYYKVH